MAGNWAESRAITQQAWSVLRTHKSLLTFPLFAVLIILGLLALFVGAIVLLFSLANVIAFVAALALMAVGLYAIQLVATVANAGMISCADEALAGRPMSLRTGWTRALARFGDLAQWTIVRMLAGGVIQRGGSGFLASGLLSNVIASAGGLAWSVITLFVLPAIMLDGTGVIASIKSSVNVVRQRWGTEISAGIRIAGRLLFIIVPGIACAVVGIFVVQSLMPLGFVLFGLAFLLLSTAGLLGGAVRTIFSVALYRFVTTGQAVGGFTAQQLNSAVRTTN